MHLEDLLHRSSELASSCFSTHIPRFYTPGQDFLDCPLDKTGGCRIAQVLEQHHTTSQGSDGIGHIPPGDIRSTPMYRFEEGIPVTDVCAGDKTEAAHEKSSNIRQDVSEDVRRHHHIILLRMEKEIECQGINVPLLPGYSRSFGFLQTDGAEKDV
jgi:hypothetical protein